MNEETKLILTKSGLLNFAEQLGNVSQAYKVMGYSRDSFYHPAWGYCARENDYFI